jgi:hypothetical protein
VSAGRALALGGLVLALLPAACGGRVLVEGAIAENDAASATPVTPSAMVIPTTESLRAVWGSSSSDVWAVGSNGAIVHFDGATWRLSNSGSTENLTGVMGTDPENVWVTGDGGSVLFWNGLAWSAVSQVNGTTLLAVWVNGASDVWAGGVDWGGGTGSAGYARHWDGTMWIDSDVPGTTGVWELWASGPHDVWMVGDSASTTGIVLRGEGSTANPFDTAAYDGPQLRGIWGAAKDDVWVAPYQGAVEHWDGSAWSAMPTTPAGVSLLGVGGTASNDVWTVGLGGVVFHYDGGAWSPSPTGTTAPLSSIWSQSATDAWVVGATGTVLHWNGTAWHD